MDFHRPVNTKNSTLKVLSKYERQSFFFDKSNEFYPSPWWYQESQKPESPPSNLFFIQTISSWMWPYKFHHINIFPSWTIYFLISTDTAKFSASLSLLCTIAIILWENFLHQSLRPPIYPLHHCQADFFFPFLLMIIRTFFFPN